MGGQALFYTVVTVALTFVLQAHGFDVSFMEVLFPVLGVGLLLNWLTARPSKGQRLTKKTYKPKRLT